MKKYKMIAVGMSALLTVYCLPVDSSTGVKDFFTAVNVEAVSDDSGSCGENCTYTFDSATGTLTISGSGNMDNYYFFETNTLNTPWYNYRESIKSVVIEKGIISIGENAFYSCDSLTSITIPDGVTSIGYGVFIRCSSLTEITIPDSVTSIGGYAFSRCSSLTEITIPDSVTSIGDVAFSSCSSLTEITIPDSVTSIGFSVFYYCRNLTSITIPDSVTSIDYRAFDGCSNLTDVYYSGTETEWNSIEIGLENEYLTNATIHYSSADDSGSCGENCTYKFDSATGTLTISGSGNMYNYDNDSNKDPWYDYRENIKSVIIENGVTSIGSYAFCYCSGLTSITIPDSVTSIGSYAFEDCDSLTSITIPDSVTSIGDVAFSSCSSLTEITIPDSVTFIGDFSFYSCTNLTSITIPDSVTSIGFSVFYDCRNLTSITIPDSVTAIDYRAFYGCSNLTDVYYLGTETEWNSITIASDNDSLTNATIHYNSSGPEETQTADVSFSVEKKAVPLDSADDEIELEFTLDSKDIKIANGKFDFTYDTNYMTLTSISAGSGVLSEDFGHNNTTASFSINSDKGAGGQLVVMTFKLKDAQEGDKYSVKVTNSGDISGIDSSGNPVTINPVYSNGYIEITAPSSSSGKAFEWKKNNWSFTNSTDYFDNKQTWYITDSDLDKLLSRCNNNEKTSIKKKLKKNSRWDGSCVGLSIISVLNAQNVFKTNNYFENTSYLYDVPAPQRDDIESLITYYHLAQKLVLRNI